MLATTMAISNGAEAKQLSSKAQISQSKKAIQGHIKDLNAAFNKLPTNMKEKIQFKNTKYKKLYEEFSENTTQNAITDLSNFKKMLVGEFESMNEHEYELKNAKKSNVNVEQSEYSNISDQIATYTPELTEDAQTFVSENNKTIHNLFTEMNKLNKLDVKEFKGMSVGLKMGLTAAVIAVMFLGYQATAEYFTTASSTTTGTEQLKNNNNTESTTTIIKKDDKENEVTENTEVERTKDTTISEQIVDTEQMSIDGTPPFSLNASNNIVCNNCSKEHLSRFNSKVPTFAKKDFVEYQNKLVAQGMKSDELSKRMTDALMSVSFSYSVDVRRGIGPKDTYVINEDGSATVTYDYGPTSNFPKGKYNVEGGEIYLQGMGGSNDDTFFYPDYATSSNKMVKVFMNYYDIKAPKSSLFNSHEYLNGFNATYKANYTHAMKLFNTGASQICSKIAAKNKLTTNESNAYLMDTYYGRSERPQDWTTQGKKAFLGLYLNDVSWNNAAAGKINQKFAQLMREGKGKMKTDGSLKGTKLPQAPATGSSDESDFDI